MHSCVHHVSTCVHAPTCASIPFWPSDVRRPPPPSGLFPCTRRTVCSCRAADTAFLMIAQPCMHMVIVPNVDGHTHVVAALRCPILPCPVLQCVSCARALVGAPCCTLPMHPGQILPLKMRPCLPHAVLHARGCAACDVGMPVRTGRHGCRVRPCMNRGPGPALYFCWHWQWHTPCIPPYTHTFTQAPLPFKAGNSTHVWMDGWLIAGDISVMHADVAKRHAVKTLLMMFACAHVHSYDPGSARAWACACSQPLALILPMTTSRLPRPLACLLYLTCITHSRPLCPPPACLQLPSCLA